MQYNRYVCYLVNFIVELRLGYRIRQGRLTCKIKGTAVNKEFGT